MKIKKLVTSIAFFTIVASYGVAPIAVASSWSVPVPSMKVGSPAWKKLQKKAKVNYACLVDNNDKYNECVKKINKFYAKVDATKAEKQMKKCVINLYEKSKKCK
jgi:hypothetical protein